MERFWNRHKDRIVGSISGFDRMRFTGTLRWMAHVDGMGKFLNSQGILLKEFGQYVEELSDTTRRDPLGAAGRCRWLLATGAADLSDPSRPSPWRGRLADFAHQ